MCHWLLWAKCSKKAKGARSAKSIGRISMERHPNQNAFTWKRMKPTVCFTAQYKSVIMMDFKVKEGAENMLIPSTVGSSILTKSPIRKKSILQWRTQFKIKQVKPQSMLLSYFPHFHHRVISARYSGNGGLEVVAVARKIAQLNKWWQDAWSFWDFAAKTRKSWLLTRWTLACVPQIFFYLNIFSIVCLKST